MLSETLELSEIDGSRREERDVEEELVGQNVDDDTAGTDSDDANLLLDCQGKK